MDTKTKHRTLAAAGVAGILIGLYGLGRGGPRGPGGFAFAGLGDGDLPPFDMADPNFKAMFEEYLRRHPEVLAKMQKESAVRQKTAEQEQLTKLAAAVQTDLAKLLDHHGLTALWVESGDASGDRPAPLYVTKFLTITGQRYFVRPPSKAPVPVGVPGPLAPITAPPGVFVVPHLVGSPAPKRLGALQLQDLWKHRRADDPKVQLWQVLYEAWQAYGADALTEAQAQTIAKATHEWQTGARFPLDPTHPDTRVTKREYEKLTAPATAAKAAAPAAAAAPGPPAASKTYTRPAVADPQTAKQVGAVDWHMAKVDQATKYASERVESLVMAVDGGLTVPFNLRTDINNALRAAKDAFDKLRLYYAKSTALPAEVRQYYDAEIPAQSQLLQNLTTTAQRYV